MEQQHFGVWAECFGVPRLRLDWSFQTKRMGESAYPKVVGGIILGTYIHL